MSLKRGRCPTYESVEPLEPRVLMAVGGGVRTELLPQELDPQIHPLQLGAALVDAPSANLWGTIASKPVAPSADSQNLIHPVSYTPFTIDESALRARLSLAPDEGNGGNNGGMVFTMPTPDGTLARFRVVESSIMDPALAAAFPQIDTYSGQGIDDPYAKAFLDVTALGFHAQVLSPTGDFYIDPYWHTETSAYVSYYGRDLYPTTTPSLDDDDHEVAGDLSAPSRHAPTSSGPITGAAAFGATLRTFRAAVATSGEYTAFWGGTVTSGLSAVVTAMNRVSGVYQTELAIKMTLVANNNLLIYTNAATDPYHNNGDDLDLNTPNINNVIGSANYDIGHVFTTASGGVAYLRVVGKSLKGGGTTGTSSPTGDGFYIDYVAHEIGHQFGGNHTFNTLQEVETSPTFGQRNPSTAYEVGSGSTIMAYAGIEGTDDLQPHSDPYFNASSIDEIRSYIGTIPSVGTSTSTDNSAPTANAGSDYVIPTGTPFALTASATDPNGDLLTYDWEERDLGAATLLSTADNGASPLFRIYNPSTSPTRFFPQLSRILAGQTTTPAPSSASGRVVERLPTVARTAMKFRVIVRDNKSLGGGVASDDMQIKVVNTGAAFLLTNLNSAIALTGGSNQEIAWNVAGTTTNDINAASVNILLSADGGNTFPIALASAVDNDGTHTVQIPFNLATTQARIKVQPTNNIFFDINNANLTITNVSSPPAQPALVVGYDTGVSQTDRVTNLNNTIAKKLAFEVGGTFAGDTVQVFSDGTLIGSAVGTAGSTAVLTNGNVTLGEGSHVITAKRQATNSVASLASGSVSITVDTIAPVIELPTFQPNLPVMTVKVPFSEEVGASLSDRTLGVTGIAPSALSFTFDNPSRTASFTFTAGYANGILPDGNYEASVKPEEVSDLAGNHPATERSIGFFVFNADANFDRRINALDFNAIATNWGAPGQNYSQGNFNYDGDVDGLDFNALALKFNMRLELPATSVAPQSSNSPFTVWSASKASLFNDKDRILA